MTVILCDFGMNNNDMLLDALHRDPELRVICLEPGQQAVRQIEQEEPDILFLASCEEETAQMLLGAVDACGVQTVVCFIGSGQEQTALSYRSKCDLFLQRPYQSEEVERCLENLKLLAGRIKRFRVVTFGHFDCFVNDIPVMFRNGKAKELLALCIDRRGGEVSLYDAITALWPHKAYDERAKRLYRKAVVSLNATLAEYGVFRLFVSTRGSCRIDPSVMKCDYYSFLDAPGENLFLFHGAYMRDYDWGEETLGRLVRLAEASCDHNMERFFY